MLKFSIRFWLGFGLVLATQSNPLVVPLWSQPAEAAPSTSQKVVRSGGESSEVGGRGSSAGGTSPQSQSEGATNYYSDPTASRSNLQAPSYWGLAARLVAALLLIAACLFLLYLVLKKWTLKGQVASAENSMFKVIDNATIAPNRQLLLVQVLSGFYLLGVGQEQIQCIEKIQKKEDIDRLKLEASKQGAKTNLIFNQWLSKRTGQKWPSVLDVTKGLRQRLKKP